MYKIRMFKYDISDSNVVYTHIKPGVVAYLNTELFVTLNRLVNDTGDVFPLIRSKVSLYEKIEY